MAQGMNMYDIGTDKKGYEMTSNSQMQFHMYAKIK